MKKFELAILGNDLSKTTSFIDKILTHTKATCDQDHIKMNIIIEHNINFDNIENLIYKLEKMNSTHLCFTFSNQELINFVKRNSNMFSIEESDEDNLIEKIIKTYEETL